MTRNRTYGAVCLLTALTGLACGDDVGGIPSLSASASASTSGAGGDASTGLGGAGGTGSGSGGEASAVGSTSGGGGGEPQTPPFDSIPWESGADVGFGVQRKDTQNPLGDAAFVGYGGYDVGLDAACAWTRALYEATLRERGVRYVYCVKGPSDPSYSKLEIGNSKIAKDLVAKLEGTPSFIVVAAHSSGSFVAHELLGQLGSGFDPTDVTAMRIVYFNLDGGQSGLGPDSVGRLKRAYFVGVRDASTSSPNLGTMKSLGTTYATKGGYLELDGADSGCAAGAPWCLHMVPIITKPHDPNDANVAKDYVDFTGRPVTTSYLDDTAAEAGLTP
ncbi:MAG: hypothetical protein FJ096_16960 [Deltaproteobacteria bacterium]|nr:hypothetical protein [Deltaproteobacteria bacterium]